jgi:hypothetical protein
VDGRWNWVRYLPAGVEVVGTGSRWEPTTLPKAEIGQRERMLVRPEVYGQPGPAAWHDWTRLTGIVRNNSDVGPPVPALRRDRWPGR